MAYLVQGRTALAWATAVALAAPAAQAQITDLFGGPGDAPRSTQPLPELDREAREPVRQAPPRAAAPAAQPAPAPVAASTPARQEKLVIYTTPTCPHCIRALKHMDQRKIAYIQKDIEHNEINRAEFSRLGGRGVPYMLMGSTVVAGFSPSDFDRKYAAWKAR